MGKSDKELYLYHKGFRILRKTGEIVSLGYYDPKQGKNVKLKYNPDPKIENTDEKTYYLPKFVVKTLELDEIGDDPEFKKALKFKRTFKQETHASMDRAAKRLEWINQWGNKEEDITKFYEWAKEEKERLNADDNEQYLRKFVFRFFLEEKIEANPLNWYLHHNDFRKWLLSLEKENGSGKYAINSLNNIISALNVYYTFLEEEESRIIKKRCPKFERKESVEKGRESFMSKEDFELIHKALGELTTLKGKKVIPDPRGKKLQVLFKTLYFTGMRKNEALGLSLRDVGIGKLREEYEFINKTVRMSDEKLYGHIYLFNQPRNKVFRAKDGTVPRKPLKLKRRESGKNARYIPLMDKELTKDLANLIKEQNKLFSKRVYGDDRANYLLFDGLAYSTLNTALRKIYSQKQFSEIHNYTPHDLRHTFSTWFCRNVANGSVSVVSKVLSHSREEITLKYLHLWNEMTAHEEIKATVDEIEEMDLDNIEEL